MMMDDEYATYILISECELNAFDSRFSDIMSKES